ncbi:FxsB family cyclophane-forming radical SAM/SPASM peptide maturase [Actinomadura rubrisoli]|uniref:FxsB family radical SAM/SPASM domain protein n=1 Tax=Actinomadura rubrisoli TaxID=2530368 RepID=A0A4R5B2C6_9ACTN|nr:FxsB family cyclophane-forming radical SAM/SPASM peptide maturase [Actinomadura rubrisoli]TDD79861.1 FxsB family radical SAM/SPASM domain protein [Actinomadura rubrisoli]
MIANGADRYRPGWAPTPFRQYILKVHGRCNLRCRYCYLYTMADQRWRARPPAMPAAVAERAAARIGEHVRAHGLDEITVVLHGGEPLLAGLDGLARTVRTVRAEVADAAHVDFSVQTNGTLLDRDFLTLFDRLGVRVGVSLDGTAATHDRFRPHGRRGSHALVTRGLAELTAPRFRHLFSGLLCVVDVDSDPLETYAALLAHRPPTVDLLLPHATWSAPPAAPPERYADWLIGVFDAWFGAPAPPTRIRLFEEIVNVLLGGGSAVEGIGTTPTGMIVVETDGGIEQSDTLSVAFEGAADLGLDVEHHDFDAALRHPRTVVRQLGAAGIPTPCRPCRWAGACGGGMYAHRYRAGAGFDHRSVYCTALDRLFEHVHGALTAGLTARRREREKQHTAEARH